MDDLNPDRVENYAVYDGEWEVGKYHGKGKCSLSFLSILNQIKES